MQYLREAGFAPPVQEGVLIWDKIKVCDLFSTINLMFSILYTQSRVIWNSANSAIMVFYVV